jgi:hypothetical protein
VLSSVMLSPMQATRIILPLKAPENTAIKAAATTRTAIKTARNFILAILPVLHGTRIVEL